MTEIKTEIVFCQPTAWLPIFAQFTSHLHTSRFKIHKITYHLVCLREPDLQEKLNQVETIPYKECDKILGSDWLIQGQRGWRLEMIGLLLCVGLRTRPGEVDEEQETLCLLTEVCVFGLTYAGVSSQWWNPSVVSNGLFNSLFTIGKSQISRPCQPPHAHPLMTLI